MDEAGSDRGRVGHTMEIPNSLLLSDSRRDFDGVRDGWWERARSAVFACTARPTGRNNWIVPDDVAGFAWSHTETPPPPPQTTDEEEVFERPVADTYSTKGRERVRFKGSKSIFACVMCRATTTSVRVSACAARTWSAFRVFKVANLPHSSPPPDD